MMKILLAGAAAVLAAQAATAQSDAPAPAPIPAVDGVDWSGLYAGIHGGYGIDGGKNIRSTGITAANEANINAGLRPRSLAQNRSGVLGGGQVGFNFQRENIVFGGEADFSYTDFRSSKTFFGGTASGNSSVLQSRLVSDLDWMGTARGRIGYRLGQGLIYGTGGYAVGRVKGRADLSSATGAAQFAGGHKYTASGWTAGAGVEFRPIAESRLSVRLETLYYDLGKSQIVARDFTGAGTGYVYRLRTNGYNTRVGLNYAF